MTRADTAYRIIDEPQPGALERFAVEPLWPFLLMLQSTLLGGAWFVLNAFSVGSATKAREVALVVVALLLVSGGFVVLLGTRLALGDEASAAFDAARRYIPIAFALLRIIPGYYIYVWQQRSVELHRYLGGSTRGGVWIFVLVFFAAPKLLAALPSGLAMWFRL